jgi:putative PIN family toxin of toxin-antitoxin system
LIVKSLPHWVLDTNVVVSGLLSPHASPGRIIDALLARRLMLVLDDRIIDEYRDVLSRPKFRIEHDILHAFLAILKFQHHLSAVSVAGLKASDPDDTKFLEVAHASSGRVLVTGNLKHYPRQGRGGVTVLSPAEALKMI